MPLEVAENLDCAWVRSAQRTCCRSPSYSVSVVWDDISPFRVLVMAHHPGTHQSQSLAASTLTGVQISG
jgi:hypothetical protein